MAERRLHPRQRVWRTILTPVFTRSVDGAFAGDDESGDIKGVDEGRGPHLLGALPTGLDLGIIVWVPGAFEHTVLLQQQVDALLEEDGSAEEGSLGDNKDAAVFGGGALVDGRLNSLGVQGFAIADGPEVGDDVALGAVGGVGVALGGGFGNLRRSRSGA